MSKEGNPEKPKKLYTRRAVLLGVGGGVVAGGGILGAVGLAGGFDSMVRAVFKPDSEVYQQLTWAPVNVDPNAVWPKAFTGDKSLNFVDRRLPANWNQIGLIQTDASELDEQRIALQGHHAVAHLVDDDVANVGVLRSGTPFLSSVNGDQARYTIGLRLGYEDVQFSMGVYVPEKDRFVAAAAGVTAIATTSLQEIRSAYPGVAVV